MKRILRASIDPAISSTRQPYSYALGSPLNRTDPAGLFDWGKALDITAAALTVVGVALLITAAVVTAPAWVPVAAGVALTAAAVVSVASTAYTAYQYSQGQASLQDVVVSGTLTLVGLIPGLGWGARVWRPFAQVLPAIGRFSPPIATELSFAQASWDFRDEITKLFACGGKPSAGGGSW